MHKSSWLQIPDDSDFSLYNIPFGIISTSGTMPRVATRIGDQIIDLLALWHTGLLQDLGVSQSVLQRSTLNKLIALGKQVTGKLRSRLQHIFSEQFAHSERGLASKAIIAPQDVKMHLPLKIGDYTDFYSSIYHATNVGSMFRPEAPLLPNWRHLPVAYHGRASSIRISGTPVKRPLGQILPAGSSVPVMAPSRSLDFELEMAFVIGKDSELGRSVPAKDAESHIFGFVLFNDWSARDIQSWEYQPLGPFLSKNFLSSISPWVVTLEALEPFRTVGQEPEVPLLPYLRTEGERLFDIKLEVFLRPAKGKEQKICSSNFRHLYWNICQQLAHHTITGCDLKVGDLIASGTISGPEKHSRGCMLELTWRGAEPLQLQDGSERSFLEDGDTVTMKGYAEKNGIRVGFGEVTGTVVPAEEIN